jgi:hypothetical protein
MYVEMVFKMVGLLETCACRYDVTLLYVGGDVNDSKQERSAVEHFHTRKVVHIC